jgi:hypothetical protein
MPYYVNNNKYKVALTKPDGTVFYLKPYEKRQLDAFFDRYRKSGLIALSAPEKTVPKPRQRKVATIQAQAPVVLPRTEQRRLRLAICLSGRAVDIDYSLSFIRQLREIHEVDVFAHFWRENEGLAVNSWSKYVNRDGAEIVLANQLASLGAIYGIESFGDRNRHFMQLMAQMSKRNAVLARKDTGVLSMYYSIFRANELRRSSVKTYDYVIRMRYDSQPSTMIEEGMLDRGSINIPNHDNFGGLNDQLAVATPDLMDIYANLYQEIEDFSVLCTHHPEALLECYLHHKGLHVNRLNYFVKIRRHRVT